MDKIKILHIITRLDKGGSSRILLDIVRNLNRDNFDIEIISGLTTKPHENLAKFSKDTGIELIFVKSLRRSINIFLDIISLFKLFRLIKEIRPDIVHLHTSKAGFLGRIAAHWANTPVVLYMPHGHIFYGYYCAFLSRLFAVIECLTAPLAERIITLTDIGREEFLKRGIGKEKQFITIANGIDIDKYCRIDIKRVENLKQELKINANCPVITVIGRLEQVKGIDIFIDALTHLSKESLDFKALIVGEGSLKERLVKKVKAGHLENKVIFLDYSCKVGEIIFLSDLIVNPALNEGQGLSILEAQALAKCVIATKVGGVPEVIEDGRTGILVEPANSHKLAEAIIKILQDSKKAERLGIEARKRVEERFSKDKMISKFKDLYLQLAESRRE